MLLLQGPFIDNWTDRLVHEASTTLQSDWTSLLRGRSCLGVWYFDSPNIGRGLCNAC